jgi:hypothetical protein
MHERKQWEAVARLYQGIGADTCRVLNGVWQSPTESMSRKRIAEHEQVIQDFLRTIYQPITGNGYRPEYLVEAQLPSSRKSLGQLLSDIEHASPRTVSLVGAHYRSVVSVRGRRSSFAVQRSELECRLAATSDLPAGSDMWTLAEEYPLLLDFWQAVFLDQYFRLFGKRTTMNEWVLEQLRNTCSAVLVCFNAQQQQSRCERFAILGECLPGIMIDLSRDLCEKLLPEGVCSQFHGATVASVAATVKKNPEKAGTALRPGANGRPSPDAMDCWFSLLREANEIAVVSSDEAFLGAKCGRRSTYAAGRLLLEETAFAQEVLSHFCPPDSTHTDEGKRFGLLHDVTRVFQAMLVYCALYGDQYLTFPQWKKDAPGCSLTLMRRRPENEAADGTAWMKGNADVFLQLWTGISEQVMTHAENCLKQSQATGPTTSAGSVRILWPQAPKVEEIWQSISDAGAGPHHAMQKDWGECLLALGMNFASEKHEGKPLGFSFLLGTPHNLIHDVAVEHEFLMLDHRDKGSILRLGHDRLQIAHTMSLIRGNYAFLQDPELALFISYPGTPLEVTHIVRLPGRKGRRTRRGCLQSATEKHNDMLACVSHGNGRAELIFDGALVGSYSEREEWKVASSYDAFWRECGPQIQQVCAEEVKGHISRILEPVVERLSDEPGHGAVLVLGRNEALGKLKNLGTALTVVFDSVEDRSLLQMREELLCQVAIEDGATLIDTSSGRVFGRWLVHAVDPKLYEVHVDGGPMKLREAWEHSGEGNPYRWPHWHKTLRWGTRHTAALGASVELGCCGLVIVISSDGPVHVFKNGKAVGIGTSDEDLVYGE